MDSTLGQGTILTLFGMLTVVFHRKLAHQVAVYYQHCPAEVLEWYSLLGGALAVVMGIALFAYPDQIIKGVLILVFGFATIFLSDWNARRAIDRYQSDKYWRFNTALVGFVATTLGIWQLLQVNG